MPVVALILRAALFLGVIVLLIASLLTRGVVIEIGILNREQISGSGLWAGSSRARVCNTIVTNPDDCDDWGDWTSSVTAYDLSGFFSRLFMALSLIIGLCLAGYTIAIFCKKTKGGDTKTMVGAMVASGVCGLLAVITYADNVGNAASSWGSGISLALVGSLGMLLCAGGTYYVGNQESTTTN